MAAHFKPNGNRQITPAPKISRNGDSITLLPSGEGHSNGFSINDGDWKLYSEPFEFTKNQTLAVKSVRYGWQTSEMIMIQ